ncbi:MAG: zf-HC2 domain-containing protein [Chloroflexota bacterium]|nr:zf-HC2 domain-containing protein [Chloroflexota bacterium]
MGFGLDHRFTQKNLSAYLDGQLTDREQERVERHLAECTDCREDLATLRSTVDLLHAMPPVPLPRSFALPASAEKERGRYRFWRRMHTMLRTATAVASLLLVLLLSGDLAISLGFVPLAKRTAETASEQTLVETRVVEAPEAAEAYVPTPSPTAAAKRTEANGVASAPPRKGAEEAVEKEAPELAVERPAGDVSSQRVPTQTAEAVEPQAGVLQHERALEAPKTQDTPTATLHPPTPTASKPPTPTPTATMTPLPTREQPPAQPTRSPYWTIWRWLRTGWLALTGLLLVLAAGLLWTWQKRRLH